MRTYKEIRIWSILLITASFFILNACSKEDTTEDKPQQLQQDTPGKIPGFGNTKGELQGTPFKLPDGVALEGEIKGELIDNVTRTANIADYEALMSSFPKHKKESIALLSSGTRATGSSQVAFEDVRGSGRMVTVVFRLKNNTATEKTVVFPAGLVIKSNSGNFQNGLLIKKTSYTVPANSAKQIALAMYCGNLSLSASSDTETYAFAVITNSASLHDLFERVKNKKINVEQFEKKDLWTYTVQVTVLQLIVWRVTDGDGLTEENKKEINALPAD